MSHRLRVQAIIERAQAREFRSASAKARSVPGWKGLTSRMDAAAERAEWKVSRIEQMVFRVEHTREHVTAPPRAIRGTSRERQSSRSTRGGDSGDDDGSGSSDDPPPLARPYRACRRSRAPPRTP